MPRTAWMISRLSCSVICRSVSRTRARHSLAFSFAGKSSAFSLSSFASFDSHTFPTSYPAGDVVGKAGDSVKNPFIRLPTCTANSGKSRQDSAPGTCRGRCFYHVTLTCRTPGLRTAYSSSVPPSPTGAAARSAKSSAKSSSSSSGRSGSSGISGISGATGSGTTCSAISR